MGKREKLSRESIYAVCRMEREEALMSKRKEEMEDGISKDSTEIIIIMQYVIVTNAYKMKYIHKLVQYL